ncbi:MAG: FtsX-like permease family protein [Campylobacterota bacterium]|nr:FtsX-like permease family protein [Campylobacterota bacterium]
MFSLMFKSAFKSLFIRKSRTFMVVLMIALSLWGLMLMQGIYDGMIKQMIDNTTRSESAHISIYAKDFRATKDIDKFIKDEKDIEKFLKEQTNIKSYTKRVNASGLVATARYSKNAFIYGVNTNDEIKQSRLDEYISKGSFDFGKKSKGIIVGYKLAKKLKVDIGKKIIISAQDINNEVSSISLKVTGIIKTNNMIFDENAVLIDIEKAKEFLSLEVSNHIAVTLKDDMGLKSLKTNINNTFNNVEAFSWGELYPALIQSKQMMVTFGYISYMIVFLTASVGIFGVVLVSVLERLREFGILRAVGTKFSYIAMMIFFESFIIGTAGFILGCILGGGTLYYFKIEGLDLSSFSDALSEFGMDAVTYAVVDPSYFITALLAVFSAVVLSILIPLRILKRSKPIEVING